MAGRWHTGKLCVRVEHRDRAFAVLTDSPEKCNLLGEIAQSFTVTFLFEVEELSMHQTVEAVKEAGCTISYMIIDSER